MSHIRVVSNVTISDNLHVHNTNFTQQDIINHILILLSFIFYILAFYFSKNENHSPTLHFYIYTHIPSFFYLEEDITILFHVTFSNLIHKVFDKVYTSF